MTLIRFFQNEKYMSFEENIKTDEMGGTIAK